MKQHRLKAPMLLLLVAAVAAAEEEEEEEVMVYLEKNQTDSTKTHRRPTL